MEHRLKWIFSSREKLMAGGFVVRGRRLSNERKKKVEEYKQMVNELPDVYGEIGSENWIQGLLCHFNEPTVLTWDDITDWLGEKEIQQFFKKPPSPLINSRFVKANCKLLDEDKDGKIASSSVKMRLKPAVVVVEGIKDTVMSGEAEMVKEARISGEAEFDRETELSGEAEMTKETELSEEIDLAKITQTTGEVQLPMETQIPGETELAKETQLPGETDKGAQLPGEADINKGAQLAGDDAGPVLVLGERGRKVIVSETENGRDGEKADDDELVVTYEEPRNFEQELKFKQRGLKIKGNKAPQPPRKKARFELEEPVAGTSSQSQIEFSNKPKNGANRKPQKDDAYEQSSKYTGTDSAESTGLLPSFHLAFPGQLCNELGLTSMRKTNATAAFNGEKVKRLPSFKQLADLNILPSVSEPKMPLNEILPRDKLLEPPMYPIQLPFKLLETPANPVHAPPRPLILEPPLNSIRSNVPHGSSFEHVGYPSESSKGVQYQRLPPTGLQFSNPYNIRGPLCAGPSYLAPAVQNPWKPYMVRTVTSPPFQPPFFPQRIDKSSMLFPNQPLFHSGAQLGNNVQLIRDSAFTYVPTVMNQQNIQIANAAATGNELPPQPPNSPTHSVEEYLESGMRLLNIYNLCSSCAKKKRKLQLLQDNAFRNKQLLKSLHGQEKLALRQSCVYLKRLDNSVYRYACGLLDTCGRCGDCKNININRQ